MTNIVPNTGSIFSLLSRWCFQWVAGRKGTPTEVGVLCQEACCVLTRAGGLSTGDDSSLCTPNKKCRTSGLGRAPIPTMSKSAFWQDPWGFHAHPAMWKALVYTDFVEWSRIGASEASQRSQSSPEKTQQLPGAALCLDTGKVKQQRWRFRKQAGESQERLVSRLEFPVSQEMRGKAGEHCQQGCTQPPTILSPVWSPGVPAPQIQGYPRAHCLLHTAYHGFVWQLVWILSLQPNLVSDLKICPTSVLRFDMNVKSVPIKRWLLPGGAGMSLGTHVARGHGICTPQGPWRGCPSNQANLEKQRWGNNQGGRESSLAKRCKEVEENPVPSAPPGRGFTPSRREVLPFFCTEKLGPHTRTAEPQCRNYRDARMLQWKPWMP